MLKKILITICALYLIGANVANASSVSTYYFKASNYSEVRIDVWGSSSDPQFLFYNDTGLSSNELFRQYVAAGLNRQIYVYVEDTCGNNCNNDFGGGDNKNITVADSVMNNSNLQDAVIRDVDAYGGKTKANVGPSSPVTKFLEAAATQLGSRAVDAVLGSITSNSTTSNSPYNIITSNGRPIVMCRMTNGTCEILKDVDFKNDGDGWKATFPALEGGVSDAAHRLNINTTIINYTITIRVTCKTVYTGELGNQKAQMICYDPR